MKISRLALLCLVPLALSLPAAVPGTASAATPAASIGASDPAPTLLTFHGTASRAQLPLGPDRVPGAPRDFRKFLRSQLHDLWDLLGHTQGCKSSPLITVRTLRTDGFAMGGVNTMPRRHCKNAGGGYAAIWAVRHGAWKEVIGTQEVPTCARLERFDIPSEIGVHECYQGNEVVAYTHA